MENLKRPRQSSVGDDKASLKKDGNIDAEIEEEHKKEKSNSLESCNLKPEFEKETNPPSTNTDEILKEKKNNGEHIEKKAKTEVSVGFSSYTKNPFQACLSGPSVGFGNFSLIQGSSSAFGGFGSSQFTIDSKPLNVSPASPVNIEAVDGGEDAGEEGNPESYEPQANFRPVIPLLEEIEKINGEEDERCILQIRAKLFKLSHVPEREGGESDANVENRPPEHEWKEVGIGPARVLVPFNSSSPIPGRLVMRRETKPGGQGTKVILNTALGLHSKPAQHGEKEVRLIALEGETPVPYVLRLKLKSEAEIFISTLQERLDIVENDVRNESNSC